MQSAHREADLRTLGEAQAIEGSSRRVHLRIDRRTVIVTTPERAERLRARYAEMLAREK